MGNPDGIGESSVITHPVMPENQIQGLEMQAILRRVLSRLIENDHDAIASGDGFGGAAFCTFASMICTVLCNTSGVLQCQQVEEKIARE